MAQDDCPKCEAGLPAWLATFADLMSLLMCFFVLLLSFATIDAIRFKKMADSMQDAFGVQREIPASEIVMGTSVIKQEFSPSTVPEPSLINEIKQQTTEIEKEKLDVEEGKGTSESTDITDGEGTAEGIDVDEAKDLVEQQLKQEVAAQAADLQASLEEEIEQGLVSVETADTNIIIRIREKGSFPSGSASLDRGFFDVMDRISEAVADAPGQVVVAGHTDNIPISTKRFRSNWELSSARAVTVLHALLNNPNVDPVRVMVEGHADSMPLVENDSRENRAVNRRVELIIKRGQDEEGEVIDAVPPSE